jgi:DNA-directed RNA polymerase sigma subunit (sigma70/sigma32)
MEAVRAAYQAFTDVASLESPVSWEGATGMANLIEDEHSPDPADSAVWRIDSERVRRDISRLSESARRVIVRRYGLEGG